jgi:hypothetical protein
VPYLLVEQQLAIELLLDGLLAGIAGLGAMKTSAPAAKDFAMEAAFGDPNADQSFIGGELSGRYLLGAATGGTLGSLMQKTAPMDQFRMDPYMPGTGTAVGLTAGLGGLGTVGGAVGGAMLASKRSSGLKGKIFAGVAGGVVGGTLGSAAGAASVLSAPIAYAGMNRNFFANSPYGNSSSSTAAALNASGNIVLGMHNSRNGY